MTVAHRGKAQSLAQKGTEWHLWGSGRDVAQFAVGGQPSAVPGWAADVHGLYRTNRPRLTRLAVAITLDRSLVEEIVQDAFVGLCRHDVVNTWFIVR
jgi:hypothetical protein